MSETRPDPDALLRRVKRDEAEAKRGRLKVFFGAAPGVGKTYAMLEAARAKRAEGVDVVIGWVETHGRAETAALAEGLERLPAARGRAPRRRGSRSSTSTRRSRAGPALLLLDELAHTNAPGSRHPKRWQDARELLEAGIDVWTTLNVQHLESLNDLVERITGVVVRETVPDHLLDEADEVEFVDLPPEDLLQRLAEGKVYLPDQAARAVKQLLPQGQPDRAARAGAAAHRRARGRRRAGLPPRPRDRGDLAGGRARSSSASGPNPESGRLVRAARRLAARLRAEWIVGLGREPRPAAALAPAERDAPGRRLRARRAARRRDRDRLRARA